MASYGPATRGMNPPRSRVVCDQRDGARDYFMFTEQARKLFAEGKIEQIEGYPSEGVTYYDPHRRHISHRC